jgi:hypothetical protein
VEADAPGARAAAANMAMGWRRENFEKVVVDGGVLVEARPVGVLHLPVISHHRVPLPGGVDFRDAEPRGSPAQARRMPAAVVREAAPARLLEASERKPQRQLNWRGC